MEDAIHKGHRTRMREKFSRYGARFFDTYELLEMLLYYTVPVKDTNPYAKRLLKRFGSLDGVLSAEISELIEVEGIGEATAKLIHEVGKALDVCENDAKVNEKDDGYSSYSLLGERLVEDFGGKEDTSVVLLLFDNAMRLIAKQKIYDVDFSSGIVRAQPIIDAAISRSASIIVLAHNHPHGPLCPTEGDRETNIMIQSALSDIGVVLAEHYIVSGSNYLGFMTHMKTLFSQRPCLSKFFETKRGDFYG